MRAINAEDHVSKLELKEGVMKLIIIKGRIEESWLFLLYLRNLHNLNILRIVNFQSYNKLRALLNEVTIHKIQ